MTTDVGDLRGHASDARGIGGSDDRQSTRETRPPNAEPLCGVEFRLCFGKGDGVAQIGDLFKHVQLLARFALGGAPAAVIEIEYGESSFGKQGGVRVDEL